MGKRKRNQPAADAIEQPTSSVAAALPAIPSTPDTRKSKRRKRNRRTRQQPVTVIQSSPAPNSRTTNSPRPSSSRANGALGIIERDISPESSVHDTQANGSGTTAGMAQSQLEKVISHLTCEICSSVFVRPFALPCGHVACYQCLVTWFRTSHAAVQDQETEQDDLINPLPLESRTKRCPSCRSSFTSRPVEIFILKYLAQVFDDTPHQDAPGPQPSKADLWDGIFPPFQICDAMETGIVIDDDDGGVPRCMTCLHEIWEGVCTGCKRTFGAHVGASDVDSERDEIDARIILSSDSEEDKHSKSDDSEEGYESSFIDDDEGQPKHENEVVSISSDSSNSDAGSNSDPERFSEKSATPSSPHIMVLNRVSRGRMRIVHSDSDSE